MRFIHQNGWRRHLLNSAAMHRGFAERNGRTYSPPQLHNLFADADRPEQSRQQPRLVTGKRSRLVDPRRALDRAKQSWRIVRSLRCAEKQIAARVQSIVKRAAHLLLEFAIEIDHYIAAR